MSAQPGSSNNKHLPIHSWREMKRHFSRAFKLAFRRMGVAALMAAMVASMILPLAGRQVAYAQESPDEVVPAAIAVDGPPMRSTTFTAAGNVGYPVQTRWNSAVPLTIEVWMNFSFRVGCQGIVDNASPTSYWFGVCQIADEDVTSSLLRFSRGNTGFVNSNPIVVWGEWHHIAVTYDGSNVTFYLDGVAVGGGALAAPALADDLLSIGGANSSEYMYGNLDELRIWSVARSQAEIRDGMLKEVRSGTGLVAAFGDGGLHENLQPIDGVIQGSGIGNTLEGFLPRDLVVPLAGTAPVLDGIVTPDTEYAGAERVIVRWVRDDGDFFAGGQSERFQINAYLLRTPTDLFIGIPAASLFSTTPPEDPWSHEGSLMAVMLDTEYLRPETVEAEQSRILIGLATLSPETAVWQVGDGAGGFTNCTDPGCPQRGTNWDVAKIEYPGGEFSPPGRSVEIRISQETLGSFDEVDGFAIGQISTPEANMAYMGPMAAVMSQPDTWATLQYGESTVSLPHVKLKGTVLNFLAPGTPRLANQQVQFGAIGVNNFTTTTDANGVYEFDVFMPFNKPMFLQVINCADCKFAQATASVLGIKPTVLGNGASFAGCVQAECLLADIVLKVKLPPGPVSFGGTQARPMARMIVNTATNQTTSATQAVITGINLHEETSFFLSPMPVLQSAQFNPDEWILFPATVASRNGDMTSVTVNVPTLPKLTKSFKSSQNSGASLAMDWRWIVMDNWFRPDWVDKRASPTFRLNQPAYPELWGLGFVNESTGSSFTEFTSVYGNNAYICVGAFGACITHVPDPLYATVFYGIYRGIISQTGGSCVGMSATSSQFASGRLNSTTFDPAASFPAGITVRPDADYDHDSTFDLLTGPARPANLWATVRTNHGRQVSSFVWRMSAEQLIDSAQDGFMEMQAARAASNQTVVSMKDPDAVFGGHAVTPYAVTDFDADTKRIMVYNNNEPLAKSPFIDFNTNDDTFKFSGYTNSGGTLFVYPVSEWNGDATFPADIPGMIGNVIFGDAGDASAATQDGGLPTPQNTTQALITTAQGQYGYLPDGTFVNTLPGVAPIPLFGQSGKGIVFSPVLIPENAPNPQITINANTERFFSLTTADGIVLGLRGDNATPGERNKVTFTSTATSLTGFQLAPQNSTTELLPQIGMNLGEQERLLFRVWGLDVEGGSSAGFSVLPEEHGILYANGSTEESEHFLIVDAVDGAAQQAGTRIFGPVEVAAGADQRITVADWPVAQSLKVETDADGDGVYEKVEMFGGRSCGSEDVDDNGVPDACQTGQTVWMPVVGR